MIYPSVNLRKKLEPLKKLRDSGKTFCFHIELLKTVYDCATKRTINPEENWNNTLKLFNETFPKFF